MVVVSQLVGRISIDGADAARSALARVGRAVDNVRSNLADSLTGATRRASTSLLDFGEKLGMVVFGLQELAGAAIGLGSALIRPHADLENFTASFKTFLKTEESAKSMMTSVQQLADTIAPFETAALASGASNLLAMKIEAKNVIPYMTAIGNAVAGLNLESHELGDIARLFGEINSTGYATGEVLSQIRDRGIDAYGILREKLGLTQEQLEDMLANHEILAKDALPALRDGFNEAFPDAMLNKSKTLDGRISTIIDGFKKLWVETTKPIFAKVSEGAGQLVAVLSNPVLIGFATNVGVKIGDAMQYVASVFQVVNTWIGNFTGSGNMLIPVLAGLGAVLAMVLVPAVWSLAAGVVAATWPFLLVGAAVASATAIFLHFYNTNQPFRDFLDAIGFAIRDVAMAIYQWITSGSALKDIMTGLQPVIAYLAPKFQELGAAFVNLRDVAMPVLIKIRDNIMQFGQKVAESGMPVKVLEVIVTGLTVGIGLLVQGLTWLVNGLSNVIIFFSTGGSNAKWLWDMLVGIGNFLVSTFTPVWTQLVTTFQTQLLPAWTQLSAAFQQAMPLFQFIGGIILGVLVVALGVLVGVITGIVSAVAFMLPGVIQAFGGLVQFISGIVQIVLGIVSFFTNLFTGKFDRLAGDLTVICTGIQTMFAGMWNMIGGLFSAAIGFLYGLVFGFINGIIGFFTTLWHALVGGSIVPDMINGIIMWFAMLPGRVIGLVAGLVSGAIGLFLGFAAQAIGAAMTLVSNVIGQIGQLPGRVSGLFNSMKSTALGVLASLASSALNAGSNVVRSIADGIRAGIGWVVDAINAVVSAITSHLPHSPAKVGPLKLLPEQGEEITTQISEGMLSGMPQLRSALGDLVGPISLSMTPGALPQGMQALPPSFASTPVSAPRGDGRPIVLEIDGRAFARGFLPYEVEAIRSLVNVRF